jgi:FMN-dependent NADH-azoreductase
MAAPTTETAMTTILQINSSLYSSQGQSSRLANDFVTRLREDNPDAQLIVRDLARDPVPHLTAERFAAFTTKPADRTREQQAIVAESDALIAELKAADVIVLGLPMYNFTISSQLKAYFDHIARAGVTFRYTETGSQGLLSGKSAYVFATRGGQYAGTPADGQTGYVRQFLGFLGIADVEFVYAEGLAMGDTARTTALAAARATIEQRLTPALA